MAKYTPTAKDRERVKKMLGYGLTQRETASLVDNPNTGKSIDPATLRKHYPDEVATGKVDMKRKLIASLYERALDKFNSRGAQAAMFLLRCQHGWVERQHVTHEVEEGSGVLVAPAQVTPTTWIERQVERASPEDVGALDELFDTED